MTTPMTRRLLQQQLWKSCCCSCHSTVFLWCSKEDLDWHLPRCSLPQIDWRNWKKSLMSPRLSSLLPLHRFCLFSSFWLAVPSWLETWLVSSTLLTCHSRRLILWIPRTIHNGWHTGWCFLSFRLWNRLPTSWRRSSHFTFGSRFAFSCGCTTPNSWELKWFTMTLFGPFSCPTLKWPSLPRNQTKKYIPLSLLGEFDMSYLNALAPSHTTLQAHFFGLRIHEGIK